MFYFIYFGRRVNFGSCVCVFEKDLYEKSFFKTLIFEKVSREFKRVIIYKLMMLYF